MVDATLRPDLDGPTASVVCEDFAGRQINLANRQIRANNFSAALRVLQTAAENCDIPRVRNKIEDTLSRWYRSFGSRASTGQISQFLRVVENQSYLPDGARTRFRSTISGDLASSVTSAFENKNYRDATVYCRNFPSLTKQSFTLYYYCGEAARQVRAYGAAASRYRWMLDNWSTDQNALSWDTAAERLTKLYLVQTNFEQAFSLSKRLATRDAQPETIMTAVMAARGRMLEPIARVGNQLLDGVTAGPAMSYAKTSFPRIRFPEYVESIYTVTGALSADVAFYGADDARLPSSSLVETASGTVSLLSSDDGKRAWLISPIDTGYLLVQYDRATVPEENVILESLLSNIQDESEWQALYDYEFRSAYPGTGSSVATLLGAAYLAGDNVEAFNNVIDGLSVIEYYAVQNQSGEVITSRSFERGQIDYTDSEWSKTSKTPALYHHQVTQNGTPLREVVWPLYDDKQWSGVVRVGITSEN
ncbi:hypothetical protein CRI94_08005 [Longibacter salinarum]|uniref:Uncharacterized protein n=1 Tax=Longibacter salinarum TaxID=1850348 RepID=A0A2A8CZF1_9BACT|nr:hypothetical protein CRI94_08005 [Longibacter salinarum]